MLLNGSGRLAFDQKRDEFFLDADGSLGTRQATGQLWQRPPLLEALAAYADEYGVADTVGIAEAIADETGVAVTPAQVAAGLRSNRYLVFRMTRQSETTL
jgi:hypothetical protein